MLMKLLGFENLDWYPLLIAPLVQIVIIFLLIYWALLSLERIAAGVKLRGLVIAILTSMLAVIAARLLELHAIEWLLMHALGLSLVVIALVFQPEIRRLFTRIGGIFTTGQGTGIRMITELANALREMSDRRIGALIVIERAEKLEAWLKQENILDCRLNNRLLISLFWKDSPFHDGAIVIRQGRIVGAGVILPLTDSEEMRHLTGTRHRAAVGITEDTDALALVVSEETGAISLADRGQLITPLSHEELEERILKALGRSRLTMQTGTFTRAKAPGSDGGAA
jgi:diadenylate cyclase